MDISNTIINFLHKDLIILSLQAILLFMLCSFQPLTYNLTYQYPQWAQTIGMCMAFLSMSCIPCFFLLKLVITPGKTFKEVSLRKRELKTSSENMSTVICLYYLYTTQETFLESSLEALEEIFLLFDQMLLWTKR